jgi:hypothetical protein
MPLLCDRGDIVHEAGRRRLSPAVRDGEPALVAEDETAGRCGWADLFAILERRGLAVDFEEGSVRFVPRGAARSARPSWLARARSAIAGARRFAAALRARPKAS